jgi:hypothetical protein
MRPSPLLLLAVVLLAGCSGAKGGPAAVDLADGTSLEFQDVDVSAKEGGISGVVLDPAIRPVAGANITLLTTGETVAADANGLFTFSNVAPGLHTLQASAPRHLPIQVAAEVFAGAVAKVRIVLAIDPTPLPYHLTLKFDAYDEAGQPLVDFAVDLVSRSFLNGTLPPMCDRCYFPFEAGANWTDILLEAVWEDSVAPVAENATQYYWNVEGPDGYQDDYCTSPCRVVVPHEGLEGATGMAVLMSPDEDWVDLQQAWTIYLTLFYVEPAPETFSVVAGTT